MMYYIINNETDPAYNLALEEYVVKELKGSFFILWQNQPTIVLGRHQNIYQEINLEYVEQQDIKIVRRNSGGGCVYHDLGNINYSFAQDQSSTDSFHFFMQPIISFLKEYNINAEISGRNDIEINQQKISGNAQYYYKNRILHHGTLLFDCDLSVLVKCLNVNKKKLQAKGVTSIKARVTNLKEFFNNEQLNTSKAFIDALMKYIAKNFEVEQYYLSKEELTKIEELAQSKYRNEKWLYNKQTSATFTNDYRSNFGLIEANLTIENNTIKDISFYGDFFAKKDVSEFVELLIGLPYQKDQVSEVLNKVAINDYFIGFSQEEIINLMFA